MELARDEIQALVEQTWQTLFGAAIELAEPGSAERDGIHALVTISGAWEGAVQLEIGAAGAEALACALLETKPGELEPDAIFDAVGEMANILAGNLKSMLPQPSRLGLPVTSTGPGLGENPHPSPQNHQVVSFHWNNTPISVRIRRDFGKVEP